MTHYNPCVYFCVLINHELMLPFFVRTALLENSDGIDFVHEDEVKKELALPLDQFAAAVRDHKLDDIFLDPDVIEDFLYKNGDWCKKEYGFVGNFIPMLNASE